jgi:hypothetical protein
MRQQPSGLADRTLFEVVLMAHRFGRARLRALNQRAIAEQINLAITLQLADEQTREWVAANTQPRGRLWAQLLED